MLLAFEAVSRSGSASLMDPAGMEVARGSLPDGQAEAGLTGLVDGLRRQAEARGGVRALAVAVGPGSFTGLRVSVVIARTLAWLDGILVHPVDSLTALACEQGDGLWWTLLPLQRDTTFHALIRVREGGYEILQGTTAGHDHGPVQLHPLTPSAVAIGPALATKPGLAQAWCPGVTQGSEAALTARGVALAAPGTCPISGEGIEPAYHRPSAPELQRQRGGG